MMVWFDICWLISFCSCVLKLTYGDWEGGGVRRRSFYL